MKKILHIQLLPILSGVQNFSLHLLDGVSASDYAIAIASKPGGALEQEVIKRGWEYIPITALRHPISILDIVAFWQIWHIIKKGKYDVVHTNSSKPGLLGRIAARIAGVPLIVHTCHGTPFQKNQSFLSYMLFAALDWLANRFGHKVVFVNHSDREHCVKLGLLREGMATTIYNAIPPRQTASLDSIAASRNARKPGDDFVIGSTLRFTLQKNVIEIISAACSACEQDDTLRFIILGDGEFWDLCRQIVDSRGMNQQILLPGWDSDIESWLPKFDIFLLYSLWESQPFSVIEAMRSGLPVIASDIHSLAELVDDSCGWLVPLHDPKVLADRIIQIAQNRPKVHNMGITARQRITELCDYSRMLEAYTAIYHGDEA